MMDQTIIVLGSGAKNLKSLVFDNLMKDGLGTEYRDRWIGGDKTYTYGRDFDQYCLEVSKNVGVIYRRCFKTDVLSDLLGIQF